MKSEIISTIIPVYNSSKYLVQCIDSILNQSYKNIEIILINDASTDKCKDICLSFKKKDKRIKYIEKPKNEGVEKARLDGLKLATGNYVFFLDADDWLQNPFVLEHLNKTINETGADYVEIGTQRVLDKYGLVKNKFNITPPKIIYQPQLFRDYFISFFGINKLSVNIWGKLYRKSTIDKANIKPLGLQMGEDLAFNLQLFPFLNKIVLLNKPGYNYRIGGMTSRYNPHFLKDMKSLFYFKEEMILKFNYRKAKQWTRYELKNVLKSEICQLITYKKYKKDELIGRISEEITDPIYDNLYDINPSENFWNEAFVIALKHKDSEELYNICRKIVLRQTPKRHLKKIAFKLLNS